MVNDRASTEKASAAEYCLLPWAKAVSV